MHDEATIELAVLMRRDPQEIDAMAYTDSLAWLHRFSEVQHAELKFQAAVHGRSLT